MKRFWVLLALLGVATLGSLLHRGREPSWTPSRAGEFWILEGDVHTHTSFAGALSTPVDIPLLAHRRQLDFVAVTEHNAWFGGAVARIAGRALAPEVIVLPSEEVTNRAYHLLAIGLSRRVDPTLSLAAIADEVHGQGGVVVAAHPTRSTWPLLLGLAEQNKLDGAEILHPTIFLHDDRAAEHAAFLAEASRRAGRPLVAYGSSDFHGGSGLGTSRTLVFARERTAEAILEALRDGRAVAVTHDGRSVGAPRWLEALAAAGYTSRAASNVSPPAAGLSALEHLASLLALAVLVVALLRPPPRLRSRSEIAR